MSMDSLGFDFSGSEFLDIGSWGNSTPIGSSPTNGGLPFSVGTPTGVQSLGDDQFASLPASSDDFNFMDSPKALASGSSAPTSTTNSATGASTTTKTEAHDDFSSSYFGGELDASTNDNDKQKFKAEDNKNASAGQSTAGTAGNDQKLKDGGNAASHDASTMASFVLGGPGSNNNSFQQTKPGPPASSSAVSSSTASTTAATTSAAPTSTTASSSRPHIDGAPAPSPQGRGVAGQPQPMGQQVQHQHPQQPQMQPQMQRYPSNPMMVNQVPGQPPGNFPNNQQFGMPPGAPMGVAPGQPAMQPNGQYMQQPFRPATSTYDEEMMRVKSMMMQHPDLIPPPMEVLRISMAQSSMMGGANYMQRVGPQGQVVNRLGGAPGYPVGYGAPPNGMMMPGQTQPQMMDPRMRTAQQPPAQRPMPGQTRTPNGSTTGAPAPGASTDNQTAWQSENDLPLRRKMIGKIVSLLQQRKPDAPAEWIRRLPDMARRLEDSLYRTAKNRDEYGDFTSLKTRLQHLAVTMGARAQHKAGVNPRPAQAVGVAGQPPAMMGPGGVPQGGMAMNPVPMQPGMAPQPHVMGNMPYGNVPGRMTPQQQQLLQQQQQQMQLQMQNNPQMRQQFTPQQLQQYQAAQMQRRQYQMQQQQAMQRQQTAMQGQPGQPAQQQPQQPGQPPQQFPGQQPQPQTLQRQNSMRQQPGQPTPQQQQQSQQQQMNQQRGQNFMQPGQQQQQQPGQQGQAQQQQNGQLQRRNSMNGMRQSSDLSGLGGESADFLNLDLSQSFMGADDLSLDGGLGGDLMKTTSDPQVTGVKRTLSQSQQQMAAAANAAAFKRSKAGAAPGQNAPRGSSPHSPSQSTSQQNAMAKPAGGASKTPPMSAVNAK